MSPENYQLIVIQVDTEIPMFFLITSEQKIDLPSKKSYQFLLSNTDEVIQK